MQFSVLASGSSGNACLVSADGYGLLIDFGLGPRALARRLDDAGYSLGDVHAALLTHLHGDHWHEGALDLFAERGIALYCHARHADELRHDSPAFLELERLDLVSSYELGFEHLVGPGWRCLPFALPHDAGITSGFRIEGCRDVLGHSWAIGYAADLGSWTGGIVERLADVDLLAIEFNHDEILERDSGRANFLINRVLGRHGHLSNTQAAELVAAVLHRSEPGRLRHLVQLHLSRQCNRAELAEEAARRVVPPDVQVHTAAHGVMSSIRVGPAPLGSRRPRRVRVLSYQHVQLWLPGWDA